MIASVYEGLGKSALALSNFKEALKIYREIGDRQDVGTVLINLGGFQHNRGKYEDASSCSKSPCRSNATSGTRTTKRCV